MTQPWQQPLSPPDDKISWINGLFFLLGLTGCGGFVLLAIYGQLDIVSVATGEVTPSSQIQHVQHLEGGIVREILVVDGEIVKKGQPLIVLESVQRGADVEELQLRMDSLKIDEVRLTAEITGKDTLEFEKEFEARHARNISDSRELFQARRSRFEIEIETQEELVIQRQQNIREIDARMSNALVSLELLQDQVKLSSELLAGNMTTQFKHLELAREEATMKGRVAEDREAIKGARSALQEARSRLKQITISYQTDIREKLGTVQRDTEEFNQRIRKFRDSLARTILRSPVDGIIKTVHVSTLSGVVKPGATVVEIVPLDDTLIVEVQLPTQDIGYVAIGQDVSIKLNSPDLNRFGSIDGQVTDISPDTLIRSDGIPYYRVRIKTDKDRFERKGQVFQLYPGAQVVASIKTGTRSVMEYILGPFIGRMGDALRER